MNHPKAVRMGLITLAVLVMTGPILASQADIDAQIKQLTGDKAGARRKARKALTEMGPPAVKALIQAASHKDRSVVKAAKMALHDIVIPTGRLGGEHERVAVCRVLSSELGNTALSPRARDYICRLLSYVGRGESVAALARAMKVQDIREMARWALSRNPTPEALDALQAALADSDAKFRVGLINAIGAQTKRRSVPVLAKELGNADESVRIAAMGAISQIADPAGIEILRQRLAMGSPKERAAARAAWLILGEVLTKSGRPLAGSAVFAEALTWKASVQEKCAALHGIALADQPDALEILLDAVKKADHPDVLGTITDALESMASPEVTKGIVAMLTKRFATPSAEAQVALLNVLAVRKDRAGEPAVVASLKAKSKAVRIAALKCLAVVGTETAAPSLAASLQMAAGDERKAAIYALGKLPAANGLKWLQGEINKSGLKDEYRCLLIESIGGRNEPGSVEAISKLLGTKQSEAVRVAGYKALGAIGRAGALPALLGGVDKEVGKDRDAAEAAMGQLEAAATKPMIEAAGKGTQFQQAALLKVLGLRFDPAVKPLLLDAGKNSNTVVAAAAIEGLRRLADPSTLAVLEAAAAKGPARGPAVAGMIRIAVKLEKGKRAEALRVYHKSLELATRDKEIRPALDRLAKLADASSFDAIRPFLTKGNAKVNAARAVLTVAVKLPDSRKADGIAAIRAAIGIAPKSGRVNDAVKKLKGWGVDIDAAKEAGFVTHWWMTGPFPSPNDKMFDATLPPEKKVDLAGKFKVGNKEYGWKKVHISDSNGVGDLRKLVASADNVACCAYAEVTSPKAQDVLFKIGSDDSVVCWLNGKRIHANKAGRGLVVDADVVKAKLEKGVNRIVVKVLNGGSDWAMCLRITDSRNKPLKLEQREK